MQWYSLMERNTAIAPDWYQSSSLWSWIESFLNAKGKALIKHVTYDDASTFFYINRNKLCLICWTPPFSKKRKREESEAVERRGDEPSHIMNHQILSTLLLLNTIEGSFRLPDSSVGGSERERTRDSTGWSEVVLHQEEESQRQDWAACRSRE